MSKQSKWDSKKATDRERKAAAQGIQDGIEFWLQESNKIIPHDEGTLERSGTTSMADNKLIGAVAYDTPYAVSQHENLNYRHPNGRKAKFLETSGIENSKEIRDYVANAIKKALR